MLVRATPEKERNLDMKKRTIYTISELSLAMMSMFNRINEAFFNCELEKVIITFEAGYKKGAFGWIENNKNWKQGNAERHCINISADYLNRPINDIMATLIHEMCHLYAMQNDIQDTSRSGIYHNKKFKAIGEAHGLIITETDKIGWSVTRLSEETKQWIDDNCTISSIKLNRKIAEKATGTAKPKQSSRKYICPKCGLIVRATKECRIQCIECNKEMILES